MENQKSVLKEQLACSLVLKFLKSHKFPYTNSGAGFLGGEYRVSGPLFN
jgi:hypothetical protein